MKRTLFRRRFSFPSGLGSSGPVTLIYDTFTDTDGVTLQDHVIAPTNTPAASWVDVKVLTSAGTPANSISGNQAILTVDHTGAVVDAGVADCTLTCDWTPTVAADNRGYLLFRYSSDGNMWHVNLNHLASTLQLYEVVSNTLTQRGTVAQTFTEGVAYQIKVVLSGDDIEVFLDTVSKITYSSSLYNTATKHGIGFRSSDSGKFDNFKVETP